ncbi:hypothetical protein [Hyphomonas sp.]|uniref:hypothetical protein n=1 Tax=Hyphomonas sp. TaxID=87 RepID=UPI00391DBA98
MPASRSAAQPLAVSPPADEGQVSEPQGLLKDLWLDRLIAEGDPGDTISLLHRQAAWRGLLSGADPASH